MKTINISHFFKIYITNLLVSFVTCSYFYKVYKPLYYISLVINGCLFGLLTSCYESNIAIFIYPIALFEITSIIIAQRLIQPLEKKLKNKIIVSIVIILFIGAIYEYAIYPNLVKEVLFKK